MNHSLSERRLPDQEAAVTNNVSDRCQTAAEQPIEQGSGQCTAVKSDGVRCAGRAITGSVFCFFHDPAGADARAAASRRRGKKTRPAVLPADTPDAPLATAAELSVLLGRTVNQLLRGQLDPKIASAAGYLLTVMMKATDLGKLEQRVAALETVLKEKQADPSFFERDEF